MYGYEIVALVEWLAQEFANDLFSTLRERQIDIGSSKLVFVGGGFILHRLQIDKSGKEETMLFVEDINPNVRDMSFCISLKRQAGYIRGKQFIILFRYFFK